MESKIEKHTIIVEGMSCGHCESAVEKAVSSLAGVLSAQVDLVTKTLVVEVDISKTTVNEIKQTVVEEGFTAV